MKTLRFSWDAITDYPISLAEARDHCRIDHDDLNTHLELSVIPAAFDWAEGITRRSLVSRTHRWVIDQLPTFDDGRLWLPRGKTQGVSSVVYVSSGSNVTLTGPSTSPAGTDWLEDLAGDNGGVIMPTQNGSWPSADDDVPAPVIVNFTAGWTDDQLPADLKQALLMHMADNLDLPGASDLKPSTDADLKRRILSPWILRP